MRVQCCVCGCVRKGAKWVPVKAGDLATEDVSHGYCPRCAAKAFREIQKRNRGLDYASSSAT